MTNIEKITMFPVELYKIKVTKHEQIKKYFMDNVYPHFEKYGPNDPVQNTLTDYGFTRDAAYCHWPMLYEWYKPDIQQILENIGFDFKRYPWQFKMKGWYNMCTSNTATFNHDHMGGPTTIQFSAVHYVKLGQENNATVFKNPNGKYIKGTTPTKNFDYLPECFYDFQRMPEIEEGDLVLFPSWLDHYVPHYTAGNLRITTALNIMMRVDDGDGN
jgi:hypothetical protein